MPRAPPALESSLPWRRWTRNAGAKSLSFVVAGALWFSVTNRLEFEDTVQFPVEYVNRAAGLTTIEPLPEKVRARIRGKGKFLSYRVRDGLCRLDLSGAQIGQNHLTFSSEDLVLPEDVEVSRVEILEPRRVTIEFDETVVRDVAIVPAVVGTPDPRYVQVGRTLLNPARARVKGPRKLVDEIALVHTREIDIDGKRGTVHRQVRLVPPDSPTVEVTPLVVEVGITIEPIVSHRVGQVRVRADEELPGGLRAAFLPETISMELEGARPVVEIAGRDRPMALAIDADHWVSGGSSLLRVKTIEGGEIRFEADESSAPAVRGAVVGRLLLPPDVEILDIEPDRIRVEVTGS